MQERKIGTREAHVTTESRVSSYDAYVEYGKRCVLVVNMDLKYEIYPWNYSSGRLETGI